MRREGASNISMARARITLCYLWRFGRLPDLVTPKRFTELVQLRKLYDRDVAMTACVDKHASKRRVADSLGDEWVTPTLACWPTLPASSPDFGGAAMFKARSGCNQYALLSSDASPECWVDLRDRANRWTASPYGRWLDEWAYRDAPRGVLAEPMLGHGGAPLTDYKIYVFGAEATHIQVHTGRGSNHRWVLFDRYGKRMVRHTGPVADLPRSLHDMLRAAERLAATFRFARVDFYEIEGRPRFGEFCFYPGSGLDRFEEDWIDVELGRHWLAALDAPNRRTLAPLSA